jgi:phage protein D
MSAIKPLVSGAEVRLGGMPLDPITLGHVLEIRVDSHLMLPDMVSIWIADPDLEHCDNPLFDIGSPVQVMFAAPDGYMLTSVFDGQVTSLEPDFGTESAVLLIRGYDRSHKLNRSRKTETYQMMSVSEIVTKVALEAGFLPGMIEVAGGPLEFVQQSNETDWSFLWRLASQTGCQWGVDGELLNFGPVSTEVTGLPVALMWGDGLLSFRPRVTGIQQVMEVAVRGWDPVAKMPIEAIAPAAMPSSEIGLQREEVVGRLGGGRITICDQPVGNYEEAFALAQSIAGELADAFVEAEGVAVGNPNLRAGAKVVVGNVGIRFAGTYTLTEATHVFRSGQGYHTTLRISGRSPRLLSTLASSAREPTWRHSVVVGVVTNNVDPLGLGRVRVRYPTLDMTHEGWWARVTAPSAGAERGLLMMPRPGDEVLLAFEHDDDEHPYILGSVWNGMAPPGGLVHKDGSFALRSDTALSAEAIEQVSVKGAAGVSVEAGADVALKAGKGLSGQAGAEVGLESVGGMTLKSAEGVTVQAGAELTVESGAALQLKGGGEVMVQAGGAIQITGGDITISASGTLNLVGSQILLG